MNLKAFCLSEIILILILVFHRVTNSICKFRTLKHQKNLSFIEWINNQRINKWVLIQKFTGPKSFYFLYSLRTFSKQCHRHLVAYSSLPGPFCITCSHVFPLTFPCLDFGIPLFPYYFFSLYNHFFPGL